MWKCSFAAVLFVLAYASHELVQLLITVWVLRWVVRYGGVSLRSYALLLVPPCLFYAVSLPALLLEAAPAEEVTDAVRTLAAVGPWNGWTVYVSEEGAQRAWSLFFRIAACGSCLLFVVVSTPVSELFQVMKKLGMPSLVLEIMQIMYRFLFLLTDTAEQLLIAQRARGGQLGFKRKIADTAIIITKLFGKTMQRYTGLTYGLTARGFMDELRLTPYEKRPMLPRRYRWESAVGVFICIIIEIGLRWREAGWNPL
nr:cobalt ECF transporter T component CbiQ [Paenibacillus turpanensis]